MRSVVSLLERLKHISESYGLA
uniref:Uncharacterized protein n=1 Tax=Nymphaea colorata TaxID=210225 RepID=A0A5K0YMH1_9MAGN|nr:unnamed protein product [Nymphaea colorata]